MGLNIKGADKHDTDKILILNNTFSEDQLSKIINGSRNVNEQGWDAFQDPMALPLQPSTSELLK